MKFYANHHIHSGHKSFTIFQTYINHRVLEVSGNQLHCSKEPLKTFVLTYSPGNSGAAETYTADEHKMAVSPSQRQCLYRLYCGTGRQNILFKYKVLTVGNMENKQLEDSRSSDGSNSFKREVVSCIRRVHEVMGPSFKGKS
jgi:hypothetical protein